MSTREQAMIYLWSEIVQAMIEERFEDMEPMELVLIECSDMSDETFSTRFPNADQYIPGGFDVAA